MRCKSAAAPIYLHTLIAVLLLLRTSALAAEPEQIRLWEGTAPGETTQSTGTPLPRRPAEDPPVVRVTRITAPSITVYPAEKPNGSSVLILPGGAFRYVVTNKERSEFAQLLNREGITAFVLNYRTSEAGNPDAWKKPLQDAQQALDVIRTRASDWNLDVNEIGIAGFSADGQVAARLLCLNSESRSVQPAYGLLIYPWNLYDQEQSSLPPEFRPSSNCPPVFLVHTSDDSSTSLGSVLFYAELKKHGIPAELHVFDRGGHGYGLRAASNSRVHTWAEMSTYWLRTTRASRGRKQN